MAVLVPHAAELKVARSRSITNASLVFTVVEAIDQTAPVSHHLRGELLTGGKITMKKLGYILTGLFICSAPILSSADATEIKSGMFQGPSEYEWIEYKFNVLGGSLDSFQSWASADVTQVVFEKRVNRYTYADYDFYAGFGYQSFCTSFKTCPTYSNIKILPNSASFILKSPAYWYGYSWGYEAYSSFPLGVSYEATVSDGATISISILRSGVIQVPEPAIWAQMIVGFGLLGSVLRFRGSSRARRLTL